MPMPERGPVARSGAEGTLRYRSNSSYYSEEGVSTMKWQAQQIYWKVALILGAIASLLLAAGAEAKWG
jgi:hypothetical protein